MTDETTTTAEGNDTFECAVRSDVRLPDDFHQWPDPERKASDAAVARLLNDHPSATIISDASVCIDDTNPRFPDGDENKGKFFGVRTVKLSHVVADQDPAVAASAPARLRAFEDEHFGNDVVRIRGQIERGSGSPYQDPKIMPPELRRQHAALEKLIETERRLADAHTALLQAEADHEATLAATEPRPDAAPAE